MTQQTNYLTYNQFYTLVKKNHPVIKQAQLHTNAANAEVLMSRGAFDPKYDFDYTRKVYDGTAYYDYLDNGLKIPTWFGADIKAGFEDNSGKFLNPTSFTPPGGLLYLGIDVPIAQNMIIDERRATLRQAQLMKNMAQAEQIKVANKLLLQATKEYWEWYYQYKKMTAIKASYDLAYTRYTATQKRALNGDLAYIDTVEAYISLQQRKIELDNALNDFQNSGIVLSTFLWTENAEPLELAPNTIPEEPGQQPMPNDTLLANLKKKTESQHPELLKLNYKISQLEIEKKLRLNNTLPALSFGARYLSSPRRDILSEVTWDYFSTHYKVIVMLSQPLFLRKERGKYQLSKIKLQQAIYEKDIQKRELLNQVSTYFNDLQTYHDLIQNQQQLVQLNEKLLAAEQQKFNTGESTLFMVIARDTKLLETSVKLYELKSKYEKTKASLYWAAAVLHEN
ncbi:MAG: TolC family protein [Cytophagaceae bacterium]|nr:TolC family protein [Cytophagaceae bacterium]MDW8455560.1 TolC family protein [Cytophagaceae bacterium]